MNSPEIFRSFRELDSDCSLTILPGTDMRNPAFLLFAATPVHDQNLLARFNLCGSYKRSAVSVHPESCGDKRLNRRQDPFGSRYLCRVVVERRDTQRPL